MDFPLRKPLSASCLALGCLLLCAVLFPSCNLSSDKGHVYLDLKADTTWARYDTLRITWSDPASSAGGELYYGTAENFGTSRKLQADAYQGQKIEITVTGITDKKIAHVEKIDYNGATGVVEQTLQILSSATILSYDPTPLVLGEKDSLDLPKVTVSPDDLFDKTLQWSSSNNAVFTVAGSRLIAQGKGSAVLSAQLESNPSKTLAVVVTVNAYTVQVLSVKFKTDSLTLRAGGPAESLLVTVLPPDANPGVDFFLSDGSKASLSSRTLQGLAAGTISVLAQSKQSPDKKDTLIVVIQPPPDTSKHVPLPAAPVIASLTPNEGIITVTWASVSGADTYSLYYGEGASVDKTGNRVKSVVSPYAISGLKNGTLYAFALSAVNVTGESDLSPVLTGTPRIPLPAAPVLVSANAGDAKATVAWNPVAGATSYTLYYAAGTSVDKSGAKTLNAVSPAVITGLTNGSAYAFAVSATSPGGESALSGILTATPGVPLPAAPALAKVAIGDGKVTVTWNPVTGAASYNLYYKKGTSVATSDSKISSAVSPADVTGLTNDAQYAFGVTTVAAGGESVLSNILTGTPKTLLPPPGRPVGVPGSGKITVSWNPVAGALSYNLYYQVGTRVSKTDEKITNAVSPQEITLLTNDNLYTFAVTTVSASGESALSASDTASAAFIAPAPTLAGVASGDTMVTLTWNSIDSAKDYGLYSSNGPTVSTTFDPQIGMRSPKVVDLDSGQHSFAVVAVYPGGKSHISNVVTINAKPVKPQPPVLVSATFSAPNLNLVFRLTSRTYSYNVYFAQGNTVDKTAATMPCQNTPCQFYYAFAPGKYSIAITAVNPAGESPLSNVVSATY